MIFSCKGPAAFRSRRIAELVIKLTQWVGEPVLCHECFCWHIEYDTTAPAATVIDPVSNHLKEVQ